MYLYIFFSFFFITVDYIKLVPYIPHMIAIFGRFFLHLHFHFIEQLGKGRKIV